MVSAKTPWEYLPEFCLVVCMASFEVKSILSGSRRIVLGFILFSRAILSSNESYPGTRETRAALAYGGGGGGGGETMKWDQ